MRWAGKQHPVEVAIEWVAPVPLALAVGWASWRLGFSSVASILLGVAGLATGFASFKIGSGAASVPIAEFQPAELAPVELDELVLEEQDAVLELCDRLEEPSPDSRVVRLFERPDPTPGELVDRIVGFLAEGRSRTIAERAEADGVRSPDASTALHEALANIRASLR